MLDYNFMQNKLLGCSNNNWGGFLMAKHNLLIFNSNKSNKLISSAVNKGRSKSGAEVTVVEYGVKGYQVIAAPVDIPIFNIYSALRRNNINGYFIDIKLPEMSNSVSSKSNCLSTGIHYDEGTFSEILKYADIKQTDL